MSNLQQRQEKIQEKRKKTEFRNFLRTIASFRPLTFCKNQGMISRYPDSKRIWKLSPIKDFERDQMVSDDLYIDDFFHSFQLLRLQQTIPSVYHVAWCENCDYSDMIHSGKNIYLSTISTYWCEDILYSFASRENTKNVINSLSISDHSENIYINQ